MSYKTLADALVDIVGSDTLSQAGHSDRHNESNAAIQAIADALYTLAAADIGAAPDPHGNEAHGVDFVDESGAATAAPVQTVNGEIGDVIVDTMSGGAYVIVQTSAGGAVEARPAAAEFPSGKVFWLLHDQPGSDDGPDDVEPLDLVFNISGTEW